jgi:1-deoxy-D-xylulose-5-phosphate reductoisomerase
MQTRQTLTILGSTGSVGVSTLDVVARHPERFRVIALTARDRADVLFAQCVRHRPRYAVLSQPHAADALARRLKDAGSTRKCCAMTRRSSACEPAEVDTVMAAIVGIAGLKPALAAARAGKKLLLANKEALVTGGCSAHAGGARGRRHAAAHRQRAQRDFQALPANFSGDLAAVGVRRILLTASGGPFRLTPTDQLADVTPDAACAHPNWTMGRKISVDSATMMNKGLEVIEARWLFNAQPHQIEVLIHPESVVHSLVEYSDGSVIAQLGNPDMRTPIAHALGFPERIAAGSTSSILHAWAHCISPRRISRVSVSAPCVRSTWKRGRCARDPQCRERGSQSPVFSPVKSAIWISRSCCRRCSTFATAARSKIWMTFLRQTGQRAHARNAASRSARGTCPPVAKPVVPIANRSQLQGVLMSLLHTTLAFLVTLGVLIVIHELGHYWVARLCNVKVLRFSVGFRAARMVEGARP